MLGYRALPTALTYSSVAGSVPRRHLPTESESASPQPRRRMDWKRCSANIWAAVQATKRSGHGPHASAQNTSRPRSRWLDYNHDESQWAFPHVRVPMGPIGAKDQRVPAPNGMRVGAERQRETAGEGVEHFA